MGIGGQVKTTHQEITEKITNPDSKPVIEDPSNSHQRPIKTVINVIALSRSVVVGNVLMANVILTIRTVNRIMKPAHGNKNAALNFVIRKDLKLESVE